MNLKSIVIPLLIVLTLVGCKKDGDFDELRHPLVLEGDFDPVLGLPLAKTQSNMIDIIEMLDTANNLVVCVDENDLLTIRYEEVMHATMVLESKHGKKGRKDASDSVLISQPLSGEVPISLFRKVQQMTEDSVVTKQVLVTMEAMLQGFVSDSLQAVIDRGAQVSFDSLKLRIDCMDGFSKTVPIHKDFGHVGVQELLDGKHMKVLTNYDFADVIQHQPKKLRYNITLNLMVSSNQLSGDGTAAILDSLAVDSIALTMDTRVDFPLQVYCKELTYRSLMQINTQRLDSLLNEAEDRIQLNDSASYLVFESKNQIPVSFGLNASLLDADTNVLVSQMFTTDSTLVGAPVTLKADNIYVSSGTTVSRVVMPIDMDLLRKLGKAQFLRFRLTGTTSSPTPGSKIERPLVEIRNQDIIDLRAYMVVSPHLHLSIPITTQNR